MIDYKYHTSLDLIPIYNFYKVFNDKDLRYLVRNVDIYEIEEIKSIDKQQIIEVYNRIFEQKTDIDTTLQILWQKALNDYYLFLKKEVKDQKCHNSFRKYLQELNKKFNIVTYDNNEFTSIFDMYEYFSSKLNYNEILEQRYIVFDYENLDISKGAKWDLDKDIIFINKALGIKIDKFKDSANYFFKLKNEAIELTKSKQKK